MTTHLSNVRAALQAAGFTITTANPLPNGHGHQVKTTTGEIVSVFATGAVVPQGRQSPTLVAALIGVPGIKLPKSMAVPATKPAAPSIPKTPPQPVAQAEGRPSDKPQTAGAGYWTDAPGEGEMPWD